MVSQHQDLWRRKEPIKVKPLELPFWASEMAQWGKALVIKSESLGSIPGIHVVEGENRPLQIVLWISHELWWLKLPPPQYPMHTN